jgi:group I intron endonuclease
MIVNPSNNIYIGQTINYTKRYNSYKNSNTSNKSQGKIYNSIKKYGFDKHNVSILRLCSREELNFWENFYIKLFDTFKSRDGLNLTSGGDSFEISNETKKKLRESIINNPSRMEESAKRIKILHEKISSGEMIHPMKGKTHTKETIEKILNTKKRRVYSKIARVV